MSNPLNELFGRAVMDSGLRDAFRSDSMEQFLLDCGFTETQARRLSELPADDLDGLLRRIHEELRPDRPAPNSIGSRWPTDGLKDRASGEDRNAAPGAHKTA